MNATQGTILIMIGALALWLTWSAKSPFASVTKEQLDAAFKQGQADAKDPNSTFNKKANRTDDWSDKGTGDKGTYNVPKSLGTLLECTSKGGTWDYTNNECVEKH